MEKEIKILIWLIVICIILYIFSAATVLNTITALSTCVIAYFTYYLFSETKSLRVDQAKQIENLKNELIRPILKLHLSLSMECFGSDRIYIHLENKGNGIAKNIKFYFLGELFETQQYIVDKLNNEPIFTQGVSFLDTHQPIKNFLFTVENILSEEIMDREKLFNSLIGLSITYVDAENNAYKSETLLNFSQLNSFEETDQLKVIATNLDSLKESLKSSLQDLGDSRI